MTKKGVFQVGDKVTGTGEAGAVGWHGVVKSVEDAPNLPTGKYYRVYFDERANHPDERAPQRKTPIVGMTATQIKLRDF